MKKTLLFVALAFVSVFAFWGCSTQHNLQSGPNSVKIKRDSQLSFHDLTRGLETVITPTQPNVEIERKGLNTTFHLSGKNFFATPTAQYVRSMGLKEMSPSTDYKLVIRIVRADTQYGGPTANVEIEVDLQDEKGREVFSQKNISTTANNAGVVYNNYGLNEAYTQALEQINWNRIASFLRTEQLPKDEPQKQVQGLGNTALEQTIVRWDIQSRPQGADIFWRVVSKTPEVKSTNNKYLQTTPYEATKALDIKGLTYQTSGNVRIILCCEKDGYMPQEKEFDVRMVLDQEEISAFFRLVKRE